MAQDTIWGYLTTDLVPGKSYDLSQFMGQFRSGAIPLLSIVSPNLDNLTRKCLQPTHLYYDMQTRVKRSTLNGAITSGTTVILNDEIAKATEYIQIDKEIILLGTTTDNLTFSTCSRGQLSTSSASHADGAVIRLMDIPAVQGSSDGTADATIVPNENTTYTGIIRQDISVPGTTEATRTNWHVGSEYARQMAEKLEGAKHILENWLISPMTGSAPATQSTASRMVGLGSRLASQITDLTAATNYELTIGLLEAAVQVIMDRGGEESHMLAAVLNIHQSQIFNKFGLPYLSTDQAGALTYNSNTRVANMGGVNIALIPASKMGSIGFLLDTQFIKVGPLVGRGFAHTYAGPDGDRVKGRVIGEYTSEIHCPWAHREFTSMANA